MMEDKTQNPDLGSQVIAQNESSLANMSQNQLIDLFIDELIKEKGCVVSDLERSRIAEKLEDAVMTEILMSMPDYLVDRINNGLDDGTVSEEFFDAAIEESGIDANKIAEKAMLQFRDDFLNNKQEESRWVDRYRMEERLPEQVEVFWVEDRLWEVPVEETGIHPEEAEDVRRSAY
mgnify:CR=1 FL=1